MRARSGDTSLAAASVPVATIGSNIFSYALLLAAAHELSKADYGQLSSLLGLLLIGTVPMLALQTVVARRTASRVGLDGVLPGAVVVAGLSFGVFAVAAVPMAIFLHLGDAGPFVVALSVPGLAVLGVAQGLAQGRREFHRLAVLIAATTAGRSVGGLLGLLIGRSVLWTLAGVLFGTASCAVAVVVAAGIGHHVALAGRHHARVSEVLGEVLHAGQAHTAFLILTSLDVLLARHVLSADAAGMYAVGSVLTRAALWLPQSVATVMFASLAERDEHGLAARRAAAVVSAVGLIAVLGTLAAGPLLVTAVGGSKYRGLDPIAWEFTLLGGLLALVQLAVVAGLAQRRIARTALLWLTILADVVLVIGILPDPSPRRIVSTLAAVAALAALASAWLLTRATALEKIQH
jgi:O-antigen/teichoic acid export membrane protein